MLYLVQILLLKSSQLNFFLTILPQVTHCESLEKVPQPPGPNHPCYAQMKKSPAILKTFIYSTASLASFSKP